jgi:hypothetical protein
MSRFIRAFSFLLLFLPVSIFAAGPLSYSGRLVAVDGSPLTGPVDITIDLFVDTTVSCTQTINGVSLVNGVFNLEVDYGTSCLGSLDITQTMQQAYSASLQVFVRITNESTATPTVYTKQKIVVTPRSAFSDHAMVANAVNDGVIEDISMSGISSNCSNGEVLKADGSGGFSCASDDVGSIGDITGVSAGTGLIGGGSTGDVTINVDVGTGASQIPQLDGSGKLVISTIPDLGASKITSGTISTSVLPQATTTTDGYLNSANWNTFNNKQEAITAGTTSQYLRGDLSLDALDTDAVTEASNLYFTDARARSAAVADAIVDAVTNVAPSQNAVSDALVLKQDVLQTTDILDVNSVNLNNAGHLRLLELGVNGSNYVEIKANDLMGGDYSLTLPASQGGSGQVLVNNGSGILSWASSTSGSVTSVGATNSTIVVTGTAQDPTIAVGTIGNSNISTGIDAIKLADGSVTNTELQYVGGLTSDAQTQIDTKAASIHNHAGSDITSGTVADARLSVNVSLIGQTIDSSEITDDEIVNADINSAAGIDATKLADGSVTNTELQYIGGLTSDAQIQLDSKQVAITGSSDIVANSIILDSQSGVVLNPHNTAAGNTGEVQFKELAASGTDYVSLKSPDAIASSLTFVLPGADGSNGQVLVTDGSGNLSWGSTTSGSVTTVTGSSPILSSGGATPDISITQANGSTDGFLDSADWTTFNNKQGSITTGTTAQYLKGDLSLGTFENDVNGTTITGFVTGANSTVLNSDTIKVAIEKLQGQSDNKATNVHAHAGDDITSGTVADARLSANVSLIGQTIDSSEITDDEITDSDINSAAGIDATKLADGSVTNTELQYIDGLTSNTQTQIDSKQATIAGTTDLVANSITVDSLGGFTLLPYGAAAGNTGEIQFRELAANGSSYVGFKSPDAVSTNLVLTLPGADGTSGQVLSTNGSGVLAWQSPSSGSVTAVTGSSPISSTGGATPDISITQANGSTDGFLDSADWTTFNNKQGSITTGTTAQYLKGDLSLGTFESDVTGTTLAGFVAGANSTVLNSDTVEVAIEKIQGQINGGVNGTDLNAQSVDDTHLNGITSSCANGEILKTNGVGAFYCASGSGLSTVTNTDISGISSNCADGETIKAAGDGTFTCGAADIYETEATFVNAIPDAVKCTKDDGSVIALYLRHKNASAILYGTPSDGGTDSYINFNPTTKDYVSDNGLTGTWDCKINLDTLIIQKKAYSMAGRQDNSSNRVCKINVNTTHNYTNEIVGQIPYTEIDLYSTQGDCDGITVNTTLETISLAKGEYRIEQAIGSFDGAGWARQQLFNVTDNGQQDENLFVSYSAASSTMNTNTSSFNLSLYEPKVMSLKISSAVASGKIYYSPVFITKINGGKEFSGKVFAEYIQSNTSVTAAGTGDIKYNTLVDDTHNAYNTTTGEFTCPVDGRYEVVFGHYIQPIAWAPGDYIVYTLTLEGAATKQYVKRIEGSFNNYLGINAHLASTKCLAGQVMKLQASPNKTFTIHNDPQTDFIQFREL